MKNKEVLLVCLYCSILFTEVFCLGSSGAFGAKSSSYGAKSTSSTKGFLGTPKNNGKTPVGTNLGESPRAAKTGGSILSAWGIITLVLFTIIGSALAYYISIFYPLICAKEGKYDVMEMTAV